MLTRRSFIAAASVAFPFITRGATAPSLRLGLVADPQYADVPASGTRFYRQSIGKLSAAIEHFNGMDLDYCINAGDTIDRDWNSFEAILKVFGASRHRFHYVLGNHDFDLADAYKERVAARLGMEARYYAIRKGGFRLLFLDTNDLSVYAWPQGSPETAEGEQELKRLAATGVPQAQPWNGSVGAKQLAWLRQQCRVAAAEKEKVIIFSHHPILPAWHHHNTWNAEALLQVVSQNRCVVAWINGHNHSGAYAERDGVPFLTLRGMVETESTTAFSTARLFADRLELTGHGREISREISFRAA